MQGQLNVPPDETRVGELLAEELGALDSPNDDSLDSPAEEGLANSPVATADAAVPATNPPIADAPEVAADSPVPRAEEPA
jgi:hypothetical protein